MRRVLTPGDLSPDLPLTQPPQFVPVEIVDELVHQNGRRLRSGADAVTRKGLEHVGTISKRHAPASASAELTP